MVLPRCAVRAFFSSYVFLIFAYIFGCISRFFVLKVVVTTVITISEVFLFNVMPRLGVHLQCYGFYLFTFI
jgi:hypothetical protein